jgi:hypothetical protein
MPQVGWFGIQPLPKKAPVKAEQPQHTQQQIGKQSRNCGHEQNQPANNNHWPFSLFTLYEPVLIPCRKTQGTAEQKKSAKSDQGIPFHGYFLSG